MFARGRETGGLLKRVNRKIVNNIVVSLYDV